MANKKILNYIWNSYYILIGHHWSEGVFHSCIWWLMLAMDWYRSWETDWSTYMGSLQVTRAFRQHGGLRIAEIFVWQLKLQKQAFQFVSWTLHWHFRLSLGSHVITLLHSISYQQIINQHRFQRRGCSGACGMGATAAAILGNTIFHNLLPA